MGSENEIISIDDQLERDRLLFGSSFEMVTAQGERTRIAPQNISIKFDAPPTPSRETRDWQSETSNDRVTFSGGKLDEIVGSRGAHLEHLGGNDWFLSVTHDDGHQTAIWFKSKDLGKVMEVREPGAFVKALEE